MHGRERRRTIYPYQLRISQIEVAGKTEWRAAEIECAGRSFAATYDNFDQIGFGMAPEPSDRLRSLFEEALRLPSSQRIAFVRRECGSDSELLKELESMLLQPASTATSIDGIRPRKVPSEENTLPLRLRERYVLQEELGRGGFGLVYLATDEKLLSRRVVVKVLHTAPPGSWARKKFRHEVAALARLNHPSIVSILDSGETDSGRPFLVMEYINGIPLRSFLRPDGVDLELAADIVRQSGTALEAAHRNGVWHRDLKPENILIQTLEDGERRVKLIDFGIARVERSEISDDPTSHVAGTFRYMAPEQLIGKPSAASDIYALGVLTYEMTTGRTPFAANTAVELHVMQKLGVQVRPRSLRPGIPELAERAILRALQFVESDRYPSVMEFVNELIRGLRPVRPLGPFARTDTDPHTGRLVVKMCDRRAQEDEFKGFLARNTVQRPGCPVFCIIHGDEGECHESMVERLAYSVGVRFSEGHDDHGPAVKLVKAPWQYEGPLEVRTNRLIGWLFECFRTGNPLRLEDTSPPKLREVLASLSVSFVFVQHEIRAARWDRQMTNLIQAYRSYLAKIPQTHSMPQMIVCITIIYPSDLVPGRNKVMWTPRAFHRKYLKVRVRRDVAEMGRREGAADPAVCDCLVLAELKPITRDDVLEWFSLHNILETEAQRLHAAAEIFGSVTAMTPRKSMAEIEIHLRTVQRAFLLERGLI